MYVHDPTYKKSKAKEFSYQYKGPFEIVDEIFPLIYKEKLLDGTCTVVHINRLKRAYGRELGSETVCAKKQGPQSRNLPRDGNIGPTEMPDYDAEISPGTQLINSGDDSLSEMEEAIIVDPSRGYSYDPDWAPRSLHLQRKLLSDNATDDIAYRLRSRGEVRSGPELEMIRCRLKR